MDQFDSSSCETFFFRLWLNVDLSINDLYGNQFINRFRQKYRVGKKWGTSRDLARNEEFSEIALINIFLVLKKKNPICGGSCGENFEISHAIDM